MWMVIGGCGYSWSDAGLAIGHTCQLPAGHDTDPRTDRHECQCGAWNYAPAIGNLKVQ